MASAQNGGYARKSISIWRIAGFFRRACFVNSFFHRSFEDGTREGSGFFACSALGGVGGQDGLGRSDGQALLRDQQAQVLAVATSDTGSSDPRTLPGTSFRRNSGTGCNVEEAFLLCGHCRCIRGMRVRPAEDRAVAPHAVHNDRELARERHLCCLHAAAFRNTHRPGS